MRIIIAAMLSAALAAGVQAKTIGYRADSLTLNGMMVRATVKGVPTSAAYLTIENDGKVADRLLSVTCACAASAMMHRTENAGGIASMNMLSTVDIPAGGKVVFAPTGLHIMLVGLKGPLKAGAVQPMTLRFEKNGKATVGFRVLDVIPR